MRKITAMFMAIVLIFLMAGCSSNTYLHKGKDEDWSIMIPKEFVKDKEEANEELKSHTATFLTENETYFVINEAVDEKLEINEDTLKEEIAEDHYLHVKKFETLDIEGFGKAYGALIEDEAIGMDMIYYRLKHKDKAISFILYRKTNFTDEQVEKARVMIKTFKGLK